jgi:hypothetical protein
MRRNVRVAYFARPRIGPLLRRLKLTPSSKLPEHLKLAWGILRDDLGVPEKSARKLIMDSMSAAQSRAESINHYSADAVESESRAKLCVAFRRIANCCRRASVSLRNRLDDIARQYLQKNRIDLETIEDFFDVTAGVFKRHPNENSAPMALRAMFVYVPNHQPYERPKNNYAGLNSGIHSRCEALKITPSMAAGVTDKLLEMANMVKLLEDWEAAN